MSVVSLFDKKFYLFISYILPNGRKEMLYTKPNSYFYYRSLMKKFEEYESKLTEYGCKNIKIEMKIVQQEGEEE